jgi:hypothetical protein
VNGGRDLRNGRPGLVDYIRTARRMRTSALVLGVVALVGWLVTGIATGGLTGGSLGAWLAMVVLGMFIVEVVVVGGSALRGMLRAGDRGERLASGDVGLLPPQLHGRRSRGSDQDGSG